MGMKARTLRCEDGSLTTAEEEMGVMAHMAFCDVRWLITRMVRVGLRYGYNGNTALNFTLMT